VALVSLSIKGEMQYTGADAPCLAVVWLFFQDCSHGLDVVRSVSRSHGRDPADVVGGSQPDPPRHLPAVPRADVPDSPDAPRVPQQRPHLRPYRPAPLLVRLGCDGGALRAIRGPGRPLAGGQRIKALLVQRTDYP